MRIVAILFVVLLSHAAAAEHSPVRAEGSLWTKYYKAGDLDALMTLYTEDAIVALHGQPALYGRAQIRAYFATRMGNSDTQFELDYERVDIQGDVAYIISKYWLIATSDAGVYRDAGRSLLVYKRVDGRWLIDADIDQATPDVGWPSPGGLE